MAAGVDQSTTRSSAQKDPVRQFIARAWASGVLARAGVTTARELAQSLQPHTNPDDSVEDVERLWLRYLAGRVPKEHVDGGSDGFARRIDRLFEGTIAALHFPLWTALQTKKMDFVQLHQVVQACVPAVRQFYFAGLDKKSEFETRRQLFRAICEPIEITRHDSRVAVDHLAVQLAVARLDWLKYSGLEALTSRNIAETLEDVALSEWFITHYEDFFDFLQNSVLTDSFADSPASKLKLGWRAVAGRSIAEALKELDHRATS